MGVFLPASALPGLRKYKYAGQDHSLISKYILGPFWRRVVLLFPLWLAPNLVTLLGLMFVLGNVVTMLIYNPTFDQICPSWVYFSYAIGLFLYQTFDACDGSQARRTGQSGPLGELFDHCVDACNTSLEVLLFASATNLGYGWPVIISQFATLINFYLTTWEEYHTGILFLSNFSGPVEGILIIVCFYVLTGILGPDIWHLNVFKVVGLDIKAFADGLPSIITDCNVYQAYLVFGAVGLGFNVLQSSSNVIKSLKSHKKPVLPAFLQVIPLLGFFVTLFLWIYTTPAVLYRHLLPLTLTIGASFAFTVGLMITAHVTSQKFPVWNVLMLLPSLGLIADFIAASLAWNRENVAIAAVYTGLGFSFAIYGCFVADVIVDITTYLDIGCLYIKHKKEKKDL